VHVLQSFEPIAKAGSPLELAQVSSIVQVTLEPDKRLRILAIQKRAGGTQLRRVFRTSAFSRARPDARAHLESQAFGS
jgi:hypothetical protein